MGTLKQAVDRVTAAKTAIGNAITAKGGTVASGDGLEEYAADIATIPTGGIEPASPKDVNFYDYDGTCVYSYTADEFAELTAMPANPSHAGLTAQGWNWSLADAKEYVAKYDELDIGQIYATSDGKTRVYITLEDGGLSPYFYMYLNANTSIDVDWGDGSTHATDSATASGKMFKIQHTYALSGQYIITVTIINGTAIIPGGASTGSAIISKDGVGGNNSVFYRNCITKVVIGNNVSLTSIQSFGLCQKISTVLIPHSITDLKTYCFTSTMLNSVNLPNAITNVGDGTFRDAYNLRSVCFPRFVTTIGRESLYSTRLTHITLPDSLTSIGASAFIGTALCSITIPENVANIAAQAFGIYSLQIIRFAPLTPPTIANVNAWQNIPSDCYILVPLNALDDYLNETNMPDDSVYMYLCYAKYASGAELPTTSTDGYSLTWYATKDDARAGTNPITVGNGKEVYAVGV